MTAKLVTSLPVFVTRGSGFSARWPVIMTVTLLAMTASSWRGTGGSVGSRWLVGRRTRWRGMQGHVKAAMEPYHWNTVYGS
ncbi:Uncharacterised protein [Mycobacteroides abscessus subsp. abscessus]|nr:Uncharacterised protein [Mycobacteroides abscessus subsp. abscessus]